MVRVRGGPAPVIGGSRGRRSAGLLWQGSNVELRADTQIGQTLSHESTGDIVARSANLAALSRRQSEDV